MRVGEVVYNYRKRTGTTMQALAERSGVSKAYISMLEKDINPATGKSITPGLDTLDKLAGGMGITIDDFLEMIDGDTVVSVANAPEGWLLLSQEDKKRVQAFVLPVSPTLCTENSYRGNP